MDKMRKVFTSEIKSIDEKEQTLVAYVSTGARDRMNESLDPTGIDVSNYRKNPVVLWAHDYSAPPIGKAVWIKRDGEGIISKVKFASTEFAQEIFSLYKDGFLKAFSVGFMPKETEDGDGEKKPRKTFKKWELLEYSAVPVPANPEALALAIQKGVLKNEILKKNIEEGWETEEEIMPEEKQPEIKKAEEVIPAEEKKEEVNPALEELMAENKLLAEQLIAKDKDISDLKFRIFKLLENTKPSAPGITVDNLANKVVEIIDGVLRKAQGKVN